MALRELFARFGFDFTGASQLKDADRGVDKLKKNASGAEQSVGALASGLLAAFTGGAVVSGLNQLAAQLDELDDLSAQTNVAADALQVYGYAAEKNGASVQEFNAALVLLQKNLGRTTEATGPQVEALQKLKIDPKNVQDLNEVLPQIFERFKDLPSATEKARVATDLFGRSGVKLLPTLEGGVEGLAALRAELNESGGLADPETIAAAGEYRDNMARLNRSVFALKSSLAAGLFPQLSKVLTVVSKSVGAVSDFTRQTTLAENAALALGATMAGPVLRAFGPFLGKGLKFAAVFAAFDDLLGFLNGKDSVIEDILDAAFGDGTATTVRMWVNDSIDQFGYFVSNADAAFATIESTQATTWQKMLAGTALLANGSVDTFSAIAEGWEAILLDMTIAIDEFVLGVGTKWNEMVTSIVGNAGPLSGLLDGLKVDDKSSVLVNEEGLAARRKRRDELQVRAYQRESGQLAGASDAQNEEARARYAPKAGFDGLMPGEAGPPVERRAQRIERERREADRAAAGLAPAAVQGTLTAAAAAGTTATMNDNKTITINFASKVSAADREAIKAAVSEAIRTENRTALEALTQTKAKP